MGKGILISIAFTVAIFITIALVRECEISNPNFSLGSSKDLTFLTGPEVCDGALTMTGELKEGVTIGGADLIVFALYKSSDLGPTYNYLADDVPPALSIVSPGAFVLEGAYVAAHKYTASPSQPIVALEVVLPEWIQESFKDYELSIWGRNQSGEEIVLNSAKLKDCSEVSEG